MQRQVRLEQVWSSSINTPKLFKEKFKAELVVLAHYPKVTGDFRGFCPIFISLFLDSQRL
jgi:hypothetical protein